MAESETFPGQGSCRFTPPMINLAVLGPLDLTFQSTMQVDTSGCSKFQHCGDIMHLFLLWLLISFSVFLQIIQKVYLITSEKKTLNFSSACIIELRMKWESDLRNYSHFSVKTKHLLSKQGPGKNSGFQKCDITIK